MPLIP
jgi:hypothetical protein